MKIRRLCMNVSAFLAVGGLAAAPMTAFADHGDKGDRGKGNKNGHHKNGDDNHRGNWNNNNNDERDDNNRGNRQGRRSSNNGNNGYYNNGYNNSGYNNQQALDYASQRRAQTKNEWRNIAIAGGLVTALGLLQHDNRLVFAGAAGGLYALWRYEEDRKSQSQIDRLRASYFSRPYFVRNGTRFDRRTVAKNGERYYQFVRR